MNAVMKGFISNIPLTTGWNILFSICDISFSYGHIPQYFMGSLLAARDL